VLLLEVCPNFYQTISNKTLGNFEKNVKIYKGILHIGIKYKKSKDGKILLGFSNVDWASDIDIHKSIYGCCFMLALGGVVSWLSKKQNSFVSLNIKLEYMALSKAIA
jgi:hypothetical protein